MLSCAHLDTYLIYKIYRIYIDIGGGEAEKCAHKRMNTKKVP
nr:MAG TPA: hypothetical protein [Caudoviricetes sp.]